MRSMLSSTVVIEVGFKGGNFGSVAVAGLPAAIAAALLRRTASRARRNSE